MKWFKEFKVYGRRETKVLSAKTVTLLTSAARASSALACPKQPVICVEEACQNGGAKFITFQIRHVRVRAVEA